MERDAEQDVHRLEQVVEALVFAAESPVKASQIADVYAEVTGTAVPEEEAVAAAVNQLNEHYEAADRALRIEAWAGGYRMATDRALAPFLKSFFQNEQRTTLSRSLMETVAIVAYRQPVTKPEVDHVRGVDSGYTLRKLLEMGLIDVEGRSESLGRPMLYGTTNQFLEQFGFESLEELPRLEEIEELLDDPQFNREKAQMLLEEGVIEPNGAPAAAEGKKDVEQGVEKPVDS